MSFIAAARGSMLVFGPSAWSGLSVLVVPRLHPSYIQFMTPHVRLITAVSASAEDSRSVTCLQAIGGSTWASVLRRWRIGGGGGATERAAPAEFWRTDIFFLSSYTYFLK